MLVSDLLQRPSLCLLSAEIMDVSRHARVFLNMLPLASSLQSLQMEVRSLRP